MGDPMRERKAGFTLVESIIAVALLGFVGLAFGFLLTTSQRFMFQNQNFTASQSEASFGLQHVQRNLTAATAISTPAVGASGSTLEFTWQRTAVDPVRTSRYQLSGTDLRFIPDITAAGTFEVIARGIESITFNRTASELVSIEVIAERRSGGDTQQMRLQTNVFARGILE